MFPVSRAIDRYEASFDHDGLIANAGLIVIATLMSRLVLERLAYRWVHTGSFAPGRKLCTVIAAMLAGATHIDHVDVLRAGATQTVLPFKVMAPSTIGTFLRSFTFGFVRQLDAVGSRLLANAWAAGAGPGDADLVIDVDSTVCEVHGHAKQGAAYGYTKCLGYHPLLATRAGTGEVLFSRMRKGSAGSSRGINRFIDELAGVFRRANATGTKTVRRFGVLVMGTAAHPGPASHVVIAVAVRDEGALHLLAHFEVAGCVVVARQVPSICVVSLFCLPSVTCRARANTNGGRSDRCCWGNQALRAVA